MNKPKAYLIRGFSLMELMVVLGILALINMMIFANYPEFSQRMALKRTSEEVALIARQAQAYALGIKRSASGGDDYFGFGIHFDKNTPKSKTLTLFTDSNKSRTYNDGDYSTKGCGGAGTECFQEFKIDTGDYVSELQICNSNEVCENVEDNTLDVVYPRASSMATINGTDVSYAKVTIKSPRGNEDKHKKYIEIWANGQISVKDPPKN